ncbi:MAG TPA: cation diffusion facilitator family transporter, partial [Chlamydiales bacterium]|nr:cation diffusion facilitator family transporter [Chlamydiales bacterium]
PVQAQAWLLPLMACILLEWMYRKLIKIATREHSAALTAEASHFRIDSLNSFIALFALLFGAIFPAWSWASDKIGALFIALFMVGVGLYAARMNLNQLLDRIPDPHFFVSVRQAAMRVEGILGTEKLLIQFSGPDAHIDIDVEVDPTLSVEKAHRLSQLVRLEIQKAWPQVREVVVHIEPYYYEDHQHDQLGRICKKC